MNTTNHAKDKKNDEPTLFAEMDTAISEPSALYSGANMPKYNPDDLIGRKGAQVYRKMMRDEQVKAAVHFKRDAILSRDYYFKLDAEQAGLTQDEATRRVDLFKQIVGEISGSFSDTLTGILSALQNGFSLSEVTQKYIEYDGRSYAGIHKIKLKPFDTFQFKVDEFGEVEALEQQVAGRTSTLDLRNFIHFVCNPDCDDHYGESHLRAAYRAWFSKDMAIRFRNIYLERHAGGFHVLTPPKGKRISPGTTEYSQITSLLSNINLKTGILLPSADYKLEAMYPSGSGSNEYNATIDQSDMMIARALLVPPLLGVSPQGGVGSYSQSSTQLEAFFWTLASEANRLEECLNEQLFRPLGELNFGDQHYPRFTWNALTEEKALQLIKTFVELVNGGVIGTTPEDEAFIREALSLPAVKSITEQPDDAPAPEVAPEEIAPPLQDEAPEEKPEPMEETIAGVPLRIAATAFKKATSRVNFAVIEKTTDDMLERHVNNIGQAGDAIFRSLTKKMREGGSLDERIGDNRRALKIDAEEKRAFNKAVNKLLKESNTFGIKEAQKEIDKAKGRAFTADFSRLELIADDYYNEYAFRVTGNFTTDALKIFENEILNGAKYGKTWQEIETAIYSAAATKGMLTLEQARDALGEALKVDNPDARLRTIVRTSTFDAINTARDAYFTDPALGNFVRAYEYSAILDSRTTDICRHLDEDNAGDHSVEWYKRNSNFRPPNHFNCRSLLVPVTELDLAEYEEGPEPEIRPQEGFA